MNGKLPWKEVEIFSCVRRHERAGSIRKPVLVRISPGRGRCGDDDFGPAVRLIDRGMGPVAAVMDRHPAASRPSGPVPNRVSGASSMQDLPRPSAGPFDPTERLFSRMHPTASHPHRGGPADQTMRPGRPRRGGHARANAAALADGSRLVRLRGTGQRQPDRRAVLRGLGQCRLLGLPRSRQHGARRSNRDGSDLSADGSKALSKALASAAGATRLGRAVFTPPGKDSCRHTHRRYLT